MQKHINLSNAIEDTYISFLQNDDTPAFHFYFKTQVGKVY